jgi:hypothetical protein
MASVSPQRDSAGHGALAAFGVCWCLMIGMFDFFVARHLSGRLYATTFETTTGVMMPSAAPEAEKTDEDSGVVRYRYEVGGKAYIGHRFRYSDGDEPSPEDRELAAVRALPEGAERTVYFNPRDPAQSVLRTGWEGKDLLILMLFTPFNAVALGFVCWWLTPVYRRLRPTELPGIQVLRDGMRTAVRLPRFGPIAVAIVTLGGGAFVMVFLLLFMGSGSYPTMAMALAAWAVVLALVLGVLAWWRRRVRSGVDDLILDPASGELSLPLTLGRKERVTIPWGQVRGAEILEEVTKDSDGSSSQYYPCLIRACGSETQRVKVVSCWSHERAERIGNWLQKEMSLPASTTQVNMIELTLKS